jgi:hypothetical protein
MSMRAPISLHVKQEKSCATYAVGFITAPLPRSA